jgi:hypothetical protein
MHVHRLALAIVFQSAILLAQTNTASIQGSVADATNKKPISGALVSAIRSGLPPASQTVTTAADGSFAVGSLSAGTYSLCVQVPNDSYLNPCDWNGLATKVTLIAGQKSAGNQLSILSGSTLQVRVDDPGQLLGKKTKDGRNPHLLAGVWGVNGLFYPLHTASKDSSGVNLQLTIPRGTTLKLQVASLDLKMADANGAALSAAGDQQTFQHGNGEGNSKSFKYTITGVKP